MSKSGYVTVANENAQRNLTVPVGGLMRTAVTNTLTIGDTVLKTYREMQVNSG